MVKPTSWRLPAVLLSLLLTAGLLWQFKPEPWQQRSQVLINRVQAVQKLQVLEARLLAHQTVSEPAWLNNNEFVILAQGKALYGVDLSQARLKTEGQQLTISLPSVKLLELIINPADIEFVGLKKGLLTSQADFEARKREAGISLQAELARQARDPELLRQAETNARLYLQSLFKSLGFEQVGIEFRANSQLRSE